MVFLSMLSCRKWDTNVDIQRRKEGICARIQVNDFTTMRSNRPFRNTTTLQRKLLGTYFGKIETVKL